MCAPRLALTDVVASVHIQLRKFGFHKHSFNF